MRSFWCPRGVQILHVGPILHANQDHRFAGAPLGRQSHLAPMLARQYPCQHPPVPVPTPACATQETQPRACEPGRLCGP